MQKRLAVEIRGIVQGVGFRPFLFRLAKRLNLNGFVRNDAQGVYLEIQGSDKDTNRFFAEFQSLLPPLAQVTELTTHEIPANSDTDFTIISSVRKDPAEVLISPDISTCPECLHEMLDPNDRRYHYPFINCTNCGPRFTIIEALPYDRKNTSMSEFIMCPDCLREYNDPANRRFHAQPNACPVCGPHVFTETSTEVSRISPALASVISALKQGKIIAIKGLGGFHLAADATNDRAVAELRRRKHRFEKPLALMLPSVAAAKKIALVSGVEEQLLASIHRPIVLCRKREHTHVSPQISLDNSDYGIMLPYTPLHSLLFELGAPEVLVMTSANISEEPICHQNEFCLEQMAGIADHFLMHNRKIGIRCDDSVLRILDGKPFFIRRSRGYAPRPVMLKSGGTSVLATGGQLKSTVALTRQNHAFISQHIGDLENLPTFGVFAETIKYLRTLLEIEPVAVIHDLHPEYLSTKWAQEQKDLPIFGLQHHYAHILSVMAEEGLQAGVIGLALDGTGYGPDGHIWGGELLIADLHRFDRYASFEPIPLPGGEQAILQPWRMAVAYLDKQMDQINLIQDIFPAYAEKIPLIKQMIDKGLNSPLTTSCGRLFDAVAAILQLRFEVTYEGQAAIILESCAQRGASGATNREAVKFELRETNGQLLIDAAPVIRFIVASMRKGAPAERLAFIFHQALTGIFTDLITRAREETGLTTVALSGGCFQNMLLMSLLAARLRSAGFAVYTNRQVPVNDGGISLGQAYWGMHNIQD